MAESEASVEPTCSPEWVKSTMESIKNAEVQCFNPFIGQNLNLNQKIRETDPEAYREWFQNFMSEQEAAAPKAVPEEMQWAKMEANMKAFVDHDPQLMKNLDMEAVKASWDFAHKVKVGPRCRVSSFITNGVISCVSSPVLKLIRSL
jgi:hypothetical protein